MQAEPQNLHVLQSPDNSCESAEETRYRLHRRFDRLGRLFGDGAVERLMGAKVAVFGLGGVGSFAAEALARSAVGHLTLVDFDDVCVTNANRQLQALRGTIGRPKAEVLAERLRLINPQADVAAACAFYNAERSDSLLAPAGGGRYDYVIDCVDNLSAKAHLLATCRARGIPVVASMGAAGKSDPTQIRQTDLSRVTVCRLARELRKLLREQHEFPKKGTFGITAVYSTEARSWPRELSYDNGMGFRCVCPKTSDEHSCESRSLVDGTAVYVTGTFGLHLAGLVVNGLVNEVRAKSRPAMDRFGYRPDDLADITPPTSPQP